MPRVEQWNFAILIALLGKRPQKFNEVAFIRSREIGKTLYEIDAKGVAHILDPHPGLNVLEEALQLSFFGPPLEVDRIVQNTNSHAVVHRGPIPVRIAARESVKFRKLF